MKVIFKLTLLLALLLVSFNSFAWSLWYLGQVRNWDGSYEFGDTIKCTAVHKPRYSTLSCGGKINIVSGGSCIIMNNTQFNGYIVNNLHFCGNTSKEEFEEALNQIEIYKAH